MAFGKRFTQDDIDRIKNGPIKDVKPDKRRVRGAQPTIMDGIKFASKLELYFYNLLNAVGIKFDFQVDVLAQEKFSYRGDTIRPIKIIIDFYLPKYDLYVDTKGWQTDYNKLKWKVVKKALVDNNREPEIKLPSNKNECDALVNELIIRSREAI